MCFLHLCSDLPCMWWSGLVHYLFHEVWDPGVLQRVWHSYLHVGHTARWANTNSISVSSWRANLNHVLWTYDIDMHSHTGQTAKQSDLKYCFSWVVRQVFITCIPLCHVKNMYPFALIQHWEISTNLRGLRSPCLGCWHQLWESTRTA